MICYVAGPYRGDVEQNIGNARAVAVALLNLGHAVICPHTMTGTFADAGCKLTDEQHIDRLCDVVERVDALVILPGESEGTRREIDRANAFAVPCYFWPDHPMISEDLERFIHDA